MPSISLQWPWQCSFSFEKCAVFTQRHLIKLRSSGFVFPCINLAFNTCLRSSRLRRKASIAFRSETSVNAHLKWIYFHVMSFFTCFWSTNVCQSSQTPYEFYFSVTPEAIHILITSNEFCEQKKTRVFSFLCNYFSFWEFEKTNSVTVASQFPLFTCTKRIFYFWAQKKTLKSKPIWFNLS